MYKKMSVKKLGRKKSHRESLIRNQLRTLFETGKLRTTTQKAKVVKGSAQSLLSKLQAKELTLYSRREIVEILGSKELLEKALKYSKQENAGIRIVRVGNRPGDNAQMSRLELIGKPKRRVKKVVESDEEKDKGSDKKVGKVNKNIERKDPKQNISGKVDEIKTKTPRAKARSGL